MSRGFRMSLIAALYCTQNLSLGMFTYAFLTIAQNEGVSLATIGAASGLSTMLVLKFLWAPLVDRYGSARLGHYRGWLLGSQLLLVIGCATLALFDPAEQFGPLLMIFALLFLVAGTQDVAADATATRLLAASERGFGNGIQSAGSSIAQVVGGGLVLVLYQTAGWQAAALFLAAFSALPMPFVLAWNEKRSSLGEPSPHVTFATVRSFFARPVTRLWALRILPLYFAGAAMAYGLIRPFLVDEQWSESRIGIVVVIVGSVFGVLAGLAGGIAIRSLGRRRAYRWLGVVQGIGCISVIVLTLGVTDIWFTVVVVALINAGIAAATALVYTISMDLTRHDSAGTDFTLFSTLASLVMVVAGGLGMGLSGAMGFAPVAGVALALCAGGVLFGAPRLDKVLNATTPSKGHDDEPDTVALA
ncbi:MAG: MFS transporter [Cumulibacter sp.]